MRRFHAFTLTLALNWKTLKQHGSVQRLKSATLNHHLTLYGPIGKSGAILETSTGSYFGV